MGALGVWGGGGGGGVWGVGGEGGGGEGFKAKPPLKSTAEMPSHSQSWDVGCSLAFMCNWSLGQRLR